MVATDVEIMGVVRSTVGQLKPKVRVSTVILFGSYASGAVRRWSDIDVAIICPAVSGMPRGRRQVFLAELLPQARFHGSRRADVQVKRGVFDVGPGDRLRTGKVV